MRLKEVFGTLLHLLFVMPIVRNLLFTWKCSCGKGAASVGGGNRRHWLFLDVSSHELIRLPPQV